MSRFVLHLTQYAWSVCSATVISLPSALSVSSLLEILFAAIFFQVIHNLLDILCTIFMANQ